MKIGNGQDDSLRHAGGERPILREVSSPKQSLIADDGMAANSSSPGGKLIVLTAPLTETIDHAGYFIQMAMASMPMWMEGVMTKKYPHWRAVEYNADGSARYMPAGVRLVEAALLREFRPEDI